MPLNANVMMHAYAMSYAHVMMHAHVLMHAHVAMRVMMHAQNVDGCKIHCRGTDQGAM